MSQGQAQVVNHPAHPAHESVRENVLEVLPHKKKGAAAPWYLNGSVTRSLAAACMEDLIPCLLGAGGASKDVNLAVPAELLNCSCVEV